MTKNRKCGNPPKWIQDAMPKRCCLCGSTKGIEFDHINPDVYQDEWTIENTRPLCHRCHRLITHGQLIPGQGEIMREHSFLIRQGIAKAKAAGRKNGRKPADYEKVMRLISENSTQFNKFSTTTEHEIMEMAGVKDVCYYKCKRMLLEAMKADVWPYAWEKPLNNFGHPVYEGKLKRLRGTV